MSNRYQQPQPVQGVTTCGTALDGTTLGTRLTYTCPAGKQAVIVGGTYARIAGTAPNVGLQATVGGVTFNLTNGTTAFSFSGRAFLNAGDTATITVVTTGAGSTFDGSVSVEEYLAAAGG